jgi:hypothetical protein
MSLFGFLRPLAKYGILVVYGDKAGVPITVYALDEKEENRIQEYIVKTESYKSLHVATFRDMKPGDYEVIEPKYPSIKGRKIYVSPGCIAEVNLLFGCKIDETANEKEKTTMYCSYCGKPNSSDFRFCNHCGKPRP